MAPILIVEDDKAVRDALGFSLAVDGFDVRLFKSAEELLDHAWCPDGGCLVVDHFMPAMTGIELLTVLRERGCSVPSILITTRADRELRRRAALAGVQHVLEKPLSDSSLIECIQDVLSQVPS